MSTLSSQRSQCRSVRGSGLTADMQSADLREPASHLKAPQELRSRLRHRLKACNSFSTVVTAGLQWLARLLSLICVPLQLKERLSGLRNSKHLSSVKSAAMERSPWWMNIDSSNLPNWKGPVGVKADGGGNIRGQGRVGGMRMHRAVHNKRLDGKHHALPAQAYSTCTLHAQACVVMTAWVHRTTSRVPAVSGTGNKLELRMQCQGHFKC